MEIYKTLMNYKEKGIYPFHMPGHKRNKAFLSLHTEPAEIDFTEIPEMDNLHDPKEMIFESQKKCAVLFGAEKSYYLINGTTSGIIASICALCQEGESIIVARNSHKSVYSALIYSGANPVYVFPKINSFGIPAGISPEEVKKALLENPKAKAVFIVSPTYEGFVSDIQAIAEEVHKYHIPLIVDEAHGSHFAFSEYFPKTALEMGADISIQSLHKTLPSYTQTSVLHTQGNLFDERLLKLHLSMIQTSSPSYILMAGIDNCVDLLYKDKKKIFEDYISILEGYRKKALSYKNFILMGEEQENISHILSVDKGKLTFVLKRAYPNIEQELLNKYKIQLEMAAENHFILMTSPADTKAGFDRLHFALSEIDEKISNFPLKEFKITNQYPVPKQIIHPKKALYKAPESMMLKDALGKVSGDFVTPYPPGIPLIAPGEEITKETLEYLSEKYLSKNINTISIQ